MKTRGPTSREGMPVVRESALERQTDAASLSQPEKWPAGTGRHPAADGAAVAPEPAGSQPSQYVRDLVQLESRFERAVPAIEMAFQPIVYAQTFDVYGYEALLRSNDPDLPHPGALLDAAERLNRTAQLGRHVRAHVARTFAKASEDRGFLFVNLHALDLLDKTLSSPFSPLAKIAHRVVLEVTERASLDSVSDIRYRVAELREMGYRIAIDDLGAGYSRMNLFTPLDTDLVKLDMSLVRDIDSHPMKQELVASIIKLCRDQSILVIGEGVETEAEAEYLISVGCDLLQGYLIARPGPPFVVPPRRGIDSSG